MSGTPVWIGQELDVNFFKVINGVPIGIGNMYEYDPIGDMPFLTYCFWQKASIIKTLEFNREPVTDRPVKEIVTREFTYACSVSAMHCLQEEFSNSDIFDSKTRWLIVFYNHSEMPRVRIEEQYILYNAVAVSGSINYTENGVTEISSISFEAEDFFESVN